MLEQHCIIRVLLIPSDMGLYKEGKTVNDAKDVHTNWVDESLLQTLGIKACCRKIIFKRFSFGYQLPYDS